jgi:hypothetical protein
MFAGCRRPLLALTLAIALLLSGGPVTGASPSTPLPQLCGYPYPAYTRFVVEDGGIDSAGNPVNFCSEYARHGGPKILGLPISRPFRIGSDVYQAFDFGVLRWRTDTADTVLVEVLDLLHTAGRDPDLLRLGIPPSEQASPDWLTDPVLQDVYLHSVHPKYGLPTSPPTPIGPYVIQRFQRGLMRRWVERPPTDLPGVVVKADKHGPTVERLMVGKLLRSSGMIPPRALVADAGSDPQAYNWSAAPDAPESFWSESSHPPHGWDALFHRAGAFDIGSIGQDASSMSQEVFYATSMGLSLAVNGYVGRDSEVVRAGFDRNLSLIDTYPWGRINAACGASARDQSCTLTEDQLAQLESRISQHLAVTRRDESVVAYWILDDNPGDVRPAIELIHQLVEQENLVDQIARPTICGFGGDLDDSRRPTTASRAAFDAALANFSPTACDAVAVYPYGRTTGSQADEASIDWSMNDLLPYMLQALRDRGWDPERQPLIGIPQTFRFGQTSSPTAVDVATQTAAYCSAGASAIVFYAWNDSALAPKAELFDAPDLRQGATDGLARCRVLWQVP